MAVRDLREAATSLSLIAQQVEQLLVEAAPLQAGYFDERERERVANLDKPPREQDDVQEALSVRSGYRDFHTTAAQLIQLLEGVDEADGSDTLRRFEGADFGRWEREW